MPRILVVEDDELLLHMYDSIFSERGFKVELASDGQAALDILQTDVPDVILVDVVMPKVDGLALLKQIKLNDKLKHIPVVIITSLTDTVIANTALKAGAARFIQKSEHRPQDVVDIVSSTLKN